MKKRLIAVLLAGMMAFSLAACGGSSDSSTDGGKKEDTSGENMQIAMITDSGDITDQSFNQTTYERKERCGIQLLQAGERFG